MHGVVMVLTVASTSPIRDTVKVLLTKFARRGANIKLESSFKMFRVQAGVLLLVAATNSTGRKYLYFIGVPHSCNALTTE